MSLTTVRKLISSELGSPKWTESYPPTDTAQAQALWKGVEADTGHPLLVHFLANLIETAKVPARDNKALARAIQLYSARKIKFMRERPERFQSAMRTLAWGIGDCDDKSRFIAASLRTFRVPVQLEFMRFDVPIPGGGVKRVGHVYPIAWIEDKWVPLESVREYPWGYDPKDRAKKRGFKMSIERVGDQYVD